MTPFEESFRVRGYETDLRRHAPIARLCDYAQEAAGNHATALGLGIRQLMDANGTSWMLSRVHVKILKPVGWGETVRVRTWPAGVSKYILCTRDAVGLDEKGETAFEYVSEWFVVDLAALKVVRPPAEYVALASEGVPRVALAATPGGAKFRALEKVDATSRILVRRADHDFNEHVNNVHYMSWALEAVPEEFRARDVREMDIVFRLAAHAGDELEVRTERVDAVTLRHEIVRLADNARLVTAETKWSA